MNKWSLLLFSVLGLLLSTTSELNFVDGRVRCCDRSSRPLLSDTRLSIYEPHCTYHTFTEISQLISPKQEIRYATKNIELKRSSRSDGRRRQFEGRQISSDERFRVLSNIVLDLEDPTLSNARGRQALREINDLQLRKNLKSFSRDNFRENHVDRSRPRNNDFLHGKMERKSREIRNNIEEELSEMRIHRFRHNEESVRDYLKDRKQERFHRRTIVIRTNIMLNPKENIDDTGLRFIQTSAGKRDMERSNLDINTRQRLFRDTRLTSDLSRDSDRRFKKDDRNSNERHVTMRLASKIDFQRYRIIRDYRRSSVREDSIEKMFEREYRNTDMDSTRNTYRRSYDEDISEEILERINSKNVIIRVKNDRFKRLDMSSTRARTIQRESEGNRIRDDKRQMNNDFEKRLFQERYSTQRLPSQNSNINRLQEIRQARIYNDIIMEDAEDYSNVFIEGTERASDQNRNRIIRKNNREMRFTLSEEDAAERVTSRNTNSVVEKRAVSSNFNSHRSEAIRRNELERRERETTRYRLDHENKNIFGQTRFIQIINSHDEDKLRDARNTQRRLIRSNAMGRKINNIRQNYDDDNVSQGFLVRDDNNGKLVSRLERERLSLTGKRAPQIRFIQRENLSKMHIRAINIQQNKMQEDNNFNGRFISNINRNVENRRARTYHEKLNREEFRNSLVREGERAFDESRIRQVKDNHEHRREYGMNVERTVDRVLTHNDRNRNNIVERGFVSIISSIGNNRLYGIIRSAVTVLRRRENDELRYWSVHENKRVSNQRRDRDMLERREDNLSIKRFAQRNVSPRNSMNNDMLSNNRRGHNDENNFQVILAKTNQREINNRFERERFSSVNKRPSNLRTIQWEYKNRIHNDYRQLRNIQENRLQKERYVKTIEKQESTIRSDFDANYENKNIKRTLILLQFREKDVPSLMRLNKRDAEQSRNGLVRNRREITRVEDYSRNIRIAEIRGLRNINDKSNIRDTRKNVITRSMETEIEFNESDESHPQRRSERINRNIARHKISINNRVLLDARSEKQRDVNRELEYIRYVRSYTGLGNSAHRENKDNIRTSDRDNTGRDAKEMARDIRASNGLQMLNVESRITKTRRTNEEERERTAFSKIRYLPIEQKTHSDNQIFEIKLQYIFYLLQGLYILGFFTKFTKNSNGIQKNRFPNWFPLFSTLEAH